MIRKLASRFTTGIAAAAVAFTTIAPLPAAAMDDKDRKVLTLLLGAAALGVILNNANKDRRKQAPQVTRHDDDYPDYGDGYWRPGHDRRHFRTVPAQCVFTLRGTRGPRDVVSGRCLEEFGLRRELPAECAFDIDAGWGSRRVYGTRCLRENGYRVAEAH